MQTKLFLRSAPLAALLLAACGGSDGPGKGQVVATVNDKDITVHELNAELQGVAVPTGEQRKQAEKAALQGLVSRQILADIARERGIDKTPAYVLQQHRANEALLVQMLQRDIAAKIPQPGKAEIDRYIAENPDLFAQRKIFNLDQIQFRPPSDINKLREFEPLTTMEQVQAKVTADKLEFKRGPGQLDTIGANPDMIRQIVKLPAGEIFIVPANGAIVASKIVGVRVEPFTGEKAQAYATNLIQTKKLNEATEKQLADKIKKAREAVKYQKGYEPPKPPAGAAPAKAAS